MTDIFSLFAELRLWCAGQVTKLTGHGICLPFCILLEAVNDALAGGEINSAFAGDGGSDGTVLHNVFAFGFDG